MSASQKVFQVPELIEAILIHLPPRDLLLSQRISTHFLTTIRRSPTLQKLLFLLPEPDDADNASVILVDITNLPPNISRRLPSHWNTNLRAAAQVPAASVARARHTGPLMRRVRVNPLLLYAAQPAPLMRRACVNLPAAPDYVPTPAPRAVDEYVSKAAGFRVRDAIIDGFTRSHDEDGDASWRRMLLTQPPVHRVHKRDYPITRWREEFWVSASSARGLRMGEVAAQLERRPRIVEPRGSMARRMPLLELYLMGATDGAAFDERGWREEMEKRTAEWRVRTSVTF